MWERIRKVYSRMFTSNPQTHNMVRNRRTFLRRTSVVTAGLLGSANAIGFATATESTEGRVEGTVTYFDGPVEDATVAFDDDITASTDESGAYSRSLESGTYEIEVSADGYADVTGTITVPAGDSITADVTLEREWGPETGYLEVYVAPAGGGSTLPSYVTIYGPDEHSIFTYGGTIPDGMRWTNGFRVDEGWWEIRVSNVSGYGDGYEEVYVEGGESTRARVFLPEGDREIPETGTIEGRVTTASGDVISDATVTIGDRRVFVDEGAFDLELPHGRYDVVATADGYGTQRGDVEVKFGRTTGLTVELESQ